MSTTPDTKIRRRRVSFHSINDVREDLRQLTSHPTLTVGKWSFAQILEHLTTTMTASFDGFGFRAPWAVRTLLAPLLRKRFLTKPMPAGFNLPARAAVLMPPDEADLSAAVDRFSRALERLERDIPRAEHPVFGVMTPEEWLQLHLRHCELHLSFVVPE